MKEKQTRVCADCIHFRQHYVLVKGWYTPTNCGHCVFPRIKVRQSLSKACEAFCGKIIRF